MAQETGGAAAAASDVNGHAKKGCQIAVVYDGRTKELDANLKAAVQALLEHAMNEFGITTNRHTMALWSEAGAELSLSSSLEDQGVKCGDTLLLRPSVVRGGRW